MKQPRRQHYITQSYLRNFCTKVKKKEVLWVYDLERRKWRQSQPLNEGVEQDFQQLDHFIGLNPSYLEDAFGEVERLAMEVIRGIVLDKCLPSSLEKFSPVVNLMGLFAGRNPFIRKIFDMFLKRQSLMILREVHKEERIFYGLIGKVLDDYSIGWPVFSTYQESKAFLESGKFKIKNDPSIIVERMAKEASRITNILMMQNWMLLEAVGAEFITSNKPVNPIWTHNWISVTPSFGLLNTFVTFPLTPNLALLGSYSPLPSFKKVDCLVVNGVNWVTANSGANALYSRSKCSLPCIEGVQYLQDFHRLLSNRLIPMSK